MSYTYTIYMRKTPRDLGIFFYFTPPPFFRATTVLNIPSRFFFVATTRLSLLHQFSTQLHPREFFRRSTMLPQTHYIHSIFTPPLDFSNIHPGPIPPGCPARPPPSFTLVLLFYVIGQLTKAPTIENFIFHWTPPLELLCDLPPPPFPLHCKCMVMYKYSLAFHRPFVFP